MSKNIFNDDETYLKWINSIPECPNPPKEFERIMARKRRKLFRAIHKASKRSSRRKIFSFRYILAPICCLLVFIVPISIYAAVRTDFIGTFISNPSIDAAAGSDPHFIEENVQFDRTETPAISSRVADANSFGRDIVYTSVTDVPVKKEEASFSIPDFTFNAQDIAVFTQKNAQGWYLKKGETLRVSLTINPYFSGSDGTGEHLYFGYLLNGVYHETDYKKSTEFSFTITAPEDGFYYPAVQNLSISYIKVVSGDII